MQFTQTNVVKQRQSRESTPRPRNCHNRCPRSIFGTPECWRDVGGHERNGDDTEAEMVGAFSTDDKACLAGYIERSRPPWHKDEMERQSEEGHAWLSWEL